MKKILAINFICFIYIMSNNAFGQSEKTNKQIVLDFYELAFNQHKPSEAAKLYLTDSYIQHNPNHANGAQAFADDFEKYLKDHPNYHFKVAHVFADADMVILHTHTKADKNDLGRAIIDLFRISDGKIVEHWDVVQAVPEKTISGNSMF